MANIEKVKEEGGIGAMLIVHCSHDRLALECH